jgi:3D (Asp-Asp-Asp) domain-containing protein
MSGILAELHDNSIITSDAVMRLKSYIAGKSPDVSVARRAVILADALNKVIDSRMPKFEETINKKMKRLLLEHTANKSSFDIQCSDIFQAAIELKESGDHFLDELNIWLSANLGRKVPREQLVNVVLKSHEFMMINPEMDISDMIAAAETAIAAKSDLPAQDEKTAAAETAEAAEAETAEAAVEAAVEAWAEAETAAVEAAISVKEYIFVNNETLKPYAVLGHSSDIFGQRRSGRSSVLTKILKDWRKSSAFAAAAVMLAVILLFGISRILDRTATGSEYIEAAGNVSDIAYTATVLTDEDLAAGSNSAVNEQKMKMKATAYDLSLGSCGKLPGEPGYGITSSGRKAEVGRTVAVDPEIIPIGSRLKITFPEEYSHLDGIYFAEDTGRLIKGSTIDIFFGEDNKGSTAINEKAMEFGVRYVDVIILDNAEKGSS